MEGDVLVVALSVLAFGVLARRLRASSLTLPMVFTTAGLVFGGHALGLLDFDVGTEAVSVLAEAALALVLFTDASRLVLRMVAREHTLAVRLLAVGLPLAILAGTGVALLVLPALPLAAAAVLAATLAPTDAALGQAFVEEEAVPGRIRQTLNVESGLNDGLAVPFITILIDVARREADTVVAYLGLFAQLVGLGVLVGAFVGWASGRLLEWSIAREWSTPSAERLATVAVAVVAFAGSELLGGNGFVATFTAGLVIGSTARHLVPRTTAFAQAEGQLLTLVTFLLFGVIVGAHVLDAIEWTYVAYGLASLLVVRPVAAALSLAGTGVRPLTAAFVGWAGPRGLASIVYAVLVAGTADVPYAEEIFVIAAVTILLSIFLHGFSAGPLSRRYGATVAARRGTEHARVPDLPLRHLP